MGGNYEEIVQVCSGYGVVDNGTWCWYFELAITWCYELSLYSFVYHDKYDLRILHFACLLDGLFNLGNFRVKHSKFLTFADSISIYDDSLWIDAVNRVEHLKSFKEY